MDAVLSGATLESTDAVDDGCQQRFVAGGEWVELSYREAADDASGFAALDARLSTDGVQTTRVSLDDQTIDVVATTSSPASISTWDASLVGGAGLATEIE